MSDSSQLAPKAMPRALLTAFALWGVMIPAQDALAKGAYALYQFQGSQDSKCIPRVSNPDGVLRKNGIGTRGASSAERQALANGIAKVQHLLGGRPLSSGWRTSYNYITSRSQSGKFTWNQGWGAINVRRPAGSSSGQNETRLMHELGHKVGNSGLYGRYNRAVRKCGLTPYCHNHARGRNEEFAEVFAAYVSRPQHLRTVCPDAYNFFSRTVFPGSNAAGSCGSSLSGDEQTYFGGTRSPRSPSTDNEDRGECTTFLCRFFGVKKEYRTQQQDQQRERGGNR